MSLDPTVGSEVRKARPCVVLTSDILNDRRKTVVVVPLSSSPKPSPPLLIPVTCDGRAVVAVSDQIRAVAKERLRSRLGSVSNDEIQAIEDGLRQILNLF